MRADILAQWQRRYARISEKNRSTDIVVLRLDHLYCIPRDRKDVNNICARMCLECLSEGYIKADTDHTFSLLFEKEQQ